MTPLQAFSELIGRPERASLPLLAAAAQVPRYADPQFDPAQVVAQVRAWGEQFQARIVPDAAAPARLRLLNHFFFGELGFAGDEADFRSADNSYLHRVIERRRGIPITLSLLYMEIGKAGGLPLQGVCFPSRFLVKLRLRSGTVFIDVFGGGKTLSNHDLHAMLRASLSGAETPLGPHLRAASDREILARLLRNLKNVHGLAQQWPQALEVMNRLVALLPGEPHERRDRGLMYERLECPLAAAKDLAAYLSMEPSPPDAAEMRERLSRLSRSASRLH